MPTPTHYSHLVFCLTIKCMKEHTQRARRYDNTEFYPIRSHNCRVLNLYCQFMIMYYLIIQFQFLSWNFHSCIRISITNKIYRYFDGINFNYCFINTTFKKMLLFVNCTENHFYFKKKWWSETSIISIQIFRGKIYKAKLFVWNDSLIG